MLSYKCVMKYRNILKFFIFFIILLSFFTCSRKEKFKETNKKRTEVRTERAKYIKIYNVNYTVKKGQKYYWLTVTFYANNSSDKTIYWFKVLVNVFSKGRLTHSIVYTPNYYKGKNTNIKYYHTLAPDQTGQFKIILGSSYKIKEKPDYVKVVTFDAGDNLDIFKNIRVNPDKYFIPYTPGD